MLSKEEFYIQFVNDLKKQFQMVEIENENSLRVGSSTTHVCLSMVKIYMEYVYTKSKYSDILKTYIKMIEEIISQYIYKINYKDVYPIIKKNDFASGESLSFYRKSWFCDLDILWVEDFGSTFRFVQRHEVTDEERLVAESYKNLSKLYNKLKRLDENV